MRAAATPDLAALAKLCAGTAYRPASDPETHALAIDSLALKRGRDKVFYPDHVVFLGVGVATDFSGSPPLVAIPGAGVLIHNDAKPAIEAVQGTRWSTTTSAEAAFILKAAPIEMLEKLGAVQERMPQKSTYFYPKLASGIVFHHHSI